jgi:hypothetical protein
MRRLGSFVLAWVAIASMLACTHDDVIIDPPGAAQGVAGLVQVWEGDFQPPAQGSITPVVRELRVHQVTLLRDVVSEGDGFYSGVDSPLVATVSSGADGSFALALEPGNYSLFVMENGRHHATLADGEGQIFPVRIAANSWADAVVDITWAATF